MLRMLLSRVLIWLSGSVFICGFCSLSSLDLGELVGKG